MVLIESSIISQTNLCLILIGQLKQLRFKMQEKIENYLYRLSRLPISVIKIIACFKQPGSNSKALKLNKLEHKQYFCL